MKNVVLLSLFFTFYAACTDENETVEEESFAVDASLFLAQGLTTATVECTLSNGQSSECLEIVSMGQPADSEMGPWCPRNISDSDEAGGIWLEGGEVHQVDGAFVENMASFYGDDTWQMYDENGDIFVTDTEDDCANAANPNVGAEYRNFCVECLPSYVEEITNTYLIPLQPIEAEAVTSFGRGGGPPGQNMGPSVRGIAFNGVVFDAPAPTDAILGAYTLAPFDDRGGHINLMAGYHYHATTGLTTNIEQDDGHAPQIGYALDGFGIFAERDSEQNEALNLDECRGHSDDNRGYHYHADSPGTNNFINCLRGVYAE